MIIKYFRFEFKEISMQKFLDTLCNTITKPKPARSTDNTEFMSQLAQFSTLEQEQQQTQYLSDISSIGSASLANGSNISSISVYR